MSGVSIQLQLSIYPIVIPIVSSSYRHVSVFDRGNLFWIFNQTHYSILGGNGGGVCVCGRELDI